MDIADPQNVELAMSRNIVLEDEGEMLKTSRRGYTTPSGFVTDREAIARFLHTPCSTMLA
jgi:hypothetical protein